MESSAAISHPSTDSEDYFIAFDANNSAFYDIDQEFQRVVATIAGDDQMLKFKTEYERMQRALVNSRDKTVKFYNQNLLLQKEYNGNTEANHTTLKNSLDDQTTISNLKSAIRVIQGSLVASAYREESGKEQFRVLRGDISSLVTTLKQGVGLSSTQEDNLQDLHIAKEQTSKELEHELAQIVQLRSRIQEITEELKHTDEQKRRIELEIFEAKEKNILKKGDIEGETRNKERLEKDLRDIRGLVSSRVQESRVKQDTVNRLADEIQTIDHHMKSQQSMLERLQKDQENLAIRSIKLQESCGDQIARSSQLEEENTAIQKETARKSLDLNKLHNETKKINKIKDILIKRNKGLDDQKNEIESKRRHVKEANDMHLEATAQIRRQVEIYKKTLDDFNREKDVIEDNYEKTIESTQKSLQSMIPFKQTRENLEVEIARFLREIHDQRKNLQQIQLGRDMYVRDAAQIQSEVVESISQIKKKEMQIYDYKKQMVQADTKLKHQQALYEAVQSDRNLHAKHLVENQAEILEMKRKLKIMNYQINGYKEDIDIKNEFIARAKDENSRLLKDIDLITDESKNLKNQNDTSQAYIRTQLAKEVELNQFVKDAELERARQEQSLQVTINERDNLCVQLMRQDGELTAAYDKIKSNSTSLMTSEKQYYQRLNQAKNIRFEIHNLSEDKYKLKSEISQLEDIRVKQRRLESEYLLEKSRVKALEQELENQINVHRWRKLEGSDPKAYEMIQLLHALQKKLIKKTKEDDVKVRLITQNEEMYLNCKALLANQVGPEAIEQVKDFARMLKDKQMQLRHMGTELNMYQAQGKEYKHTVEKLDQEILSLKSFYIKEYYRRASKTAHSTAQPTLPPIPLSGSQVGLVMSHQQEESSIAGYKSRPTTASFQDIMVEGDFRDDQVKSPGAIINEEPKYPLLQDIPMKANTEEPHQVEEEVNDEEMEAISKEPQIEELANDEEIEAPQVKEEGNDEEMEAESKEPQTEELANDEEMEAESKESSIKALVNGEETAVQTAEALVSPPVETTAEDLVSPPVESTALKGDPSDIHDKSEEANEFL